MVRQRFIFMFFVMAFGFLSVAHVTYAKDKVPPESIDPKKDQPVFVTASDGNVYQFNVELAISSKEREQGLMNRMSMPLDEGMLFMWRKPRPLGFWMKDTYIPLDIIFINEDGSINKVHANAVPLDETPVKSDGPVKAVLEINGGVAGKLKIKAGDTVHHNFFRNMLAQ